MHMHRPLPRFEKCARDTGTKLEAQHTIKAKRDKKRRINEMKWTNQIKLMFIIQQWSDKEVLANNHLIEIM
ncbi:15990_t:CDS:2 [Funneliformis caledonium]|uniref:15990_t:CDS:1 n=1 Tax=Funneliformis caledonium TaxID=1117310 RepID=A0A9N9FQU4_9GLOM|nr:15990_t:CDS:2 [Funneliformis caledonium]